MRPFEREALSQAKRLAINLPEVSGVDFGVLYTNGKARGRRSGIRFHMTRKRPLSELAAHEVLPSAINGVPVDVIEARYGLHAVQRRGPSDPLQPGISVGSVPHLSTGTLGAFVRDAATGALCMLSNWHVLCASTAAAAGDAITQPGVGHLGAGAARPVASLLRWLDLSHGLDAAIATMATGVALNHAPFEVQRTIAGVMEPAVNMRLVKSGAISGVTHAKVDGVGGSYPMNYAPMGDVRRWMDGIRLVADAQSPEDEISLAGDSGSLWLDVATGAAVGLHFGGEDGLGPLAEYALAHPMSVVCQRLGIEPVG